MKKNTKCWQTWVALGLLLAVQGVEAQAHDTGLPNDRVVLRYRIEVMQKNGAWKPVKSSRTFKKNQQIRFRFISNTAGSLYVLNTSEEASSPKPVFDEVGKGELRGRLGLGTPIETNQVGIFPPPARGSAMRFTGFEGKERFLVMFVPDEQASLREVLGIVPGAEDWDFEDQATHMVTGEKDRILFRYFELKSK